MYLLVQYHIVLLAMFCEYGWIINWSLNMIDTITQYFLQQKMIDAKLNLFIFQEALKDSENPLAVQSILLQKARHSATLSRLEKEIEVRDRAR